ncbi:MAG: hypothetical protein IJZ83_03965 [Clostridia bacterium]|nr:hypothetical protein [Clostridia bacterium]
MKRTAMKKMLSICLAVLMIALAIPFTLLTVGAEDSLIKSASITLTSGTTNDENERAYGSIAGMIDGDAGDPTTVERYYQSKHIEADKKYYSLVDGKFVRDTSSVYDYYGYAKFELTSEVSLESMTIWLAGDNADQWKTPANNWGINDAYDILYSTDGDTWTVKASFENMCGVNNGNSFSVGEGFPAEGEDGYHVLTHHGYTHVGHRIALEGIEASYIAIAIKGLDHSGSPTVVIGDVTFEELVQEPAPEDTNGKLLLDVNFKTKESLIDKESYDGLDETVSDDGKCAELKVNTDKIPSVAGGVWGFEVDNSQEMWKTPGKAFTVVFTVTAEDEDQSVGLFLKWKDGFFVKPGQNKYLLGHCSNDGADIDKYLAETTYPGSGSLTQTYAISIANGSEAGNDGKYECSVYNLYVKQDGVWQLICALDAETRQKIAWNTTDYELMLHFARISEEIEEDVYSNTGSVTVSDVKIYNGYDFFPKFGLADGASVRMSTPTGLRFTGAIDKAYLAELKEEYDTENVTVGMLITPTDYLMGIDFTKQALGNTAHDPAYLEIDADAMVDKGNYYKINCVIANVLEDNYDRAFSARLYIKIDGEIVAYSEYNEKDNSRSIAEVAEAAYKDLKDSSDDTYKYEVTLEGGIKKYSPYENREVLEVFLGKGNRNNILFPDGDDL